MISRRITSSDIGMICLHREKMFKEAAVTDDALAAMPTPFRRWLEKRLSDGAYFGFVVAEDGKAIGAIGLMVIDWPPHPHIPLTSDEAMC
jgi:hypothetical protein